MARTTKTEESLNLTPEEIEAIKQFRANKEVGINAPALTQIAEAFAVALERTKPKEKKTPYNRKKGGPWATTDGSVKPMLRRPTFQHGIQLTENTLSKEEIELLNLVKPGLYCENFIRVVKRKDKGIDIDYPVRTNAQRLKLANQFGINSLSDLCNRLISEAKNPKAYKTDDEDDD